MCVCVRARVGGWVGFVDGQRQQNRACGPCGVPCGYCNTSTSTSPLTSRQDPFSFLARAVTVPERGVYGTGRGVLTLVKRDSNPPVTGLRVIVPETLT